jgi:hypothetical protein
MNDGRPVFPLGTLDKPRGRTPLDFWGRRTPVTRVEHKVHFMTQTSHGPAC